MDERSLAVTRRSLHGVAELVLAGPQYRQVSEIKLRVLPGGFGTVAAPDLRVDGHVLVTSMGPLPLAGSFAELAAMAGVEARPLDDLYSGGPGVGVHEQIEVDPEAARVLADAFAQGDAALLAFAPDEVPVLWPEHFDIGVSVGEANYGVSPGDDAIPEPYAYVGPWTPRSGAFWNEPFGAARPMHALADVEAVLAFFRAGRSLVDN